MSVHINPKDPGFAKTRWITSETCANFIQQHYWREKRLTILKLKIEGLPDDHRSKPKCLCVLAGLFNSVGSQVECERLRTDGSKLWRGRGRGREVAEVLGFLSDANQMLDRCGEGIKEAVEALEISRQHCNAADRHRTQLDRPRFPVAQRRTARRCEQFASRAVDLSGGRERRTSNRVLGEREKAISHFEVVPGIASFGQRYHLFWTRHSLANLFRLEDALMALVVQ